MMDKLCVHMTFSRFSKYNYMFMDACRMALPTQAIKWGIFHSSVTIFVDTVCDWCLVFPS